ncbi:hypothetical protein DH2020_014197 [Rehmannia glutinosa]|uniref:C2H2-type domain-containing protein n=1 Tax=Rehmannia glutinosa TaxID=99300 RepID=A0ABR0WVP8_REHGL
MEFKNRGINQQDSMRVPSLSIYGYPTEKAHRAYSMGPNMGQTQHEFFRDFHHPHHLHPHARLNPLFHHPLPPNPHYMRDAILIEIEKEKIREEIIISEIVRRRVFEVQVRTDLMIERELALRRNTDGFPIRPSEFDSPTRLSVLGTRADGSSSKRLNGRPESGGFETLPFQKGAADLKIPEVKPVSEGGKEKHDVIFMGKPNENISGSKRKAVTPPPVVNASELPSSGGISNKKAKEEWSCAICSVSRTNLRAFNDHLQGKKHMSKVAALRAENAGKNCSIGFFPTEADLQLNICHSRRITRTLITRKS